MAKLNRKGNFEDKINKTIKQNQANLIKVWPFI